MESKTNFLGHPDWNSFVATEDFEKNYRILKSVAKKCEQNFEASFNSLMPAIRKNYGDQVANGIQQNLGKGPYDQISP